MTNGIIQQGLVYQSQKGTPVTDSLKVAQVFGKEHRSLLRTIRDILGSAQNCAHVKWFYESTYMDVQGKARPMFVMNRDGFSLLAMGLTGAKAMQFKVGFIEQFNQMEAIVKEVSQRPAIPQTLSEALRLAADQAEQIEQQQKQLEAQQPRVLFSQAVETSKESVLIGELAKIICQNGVQIGEKRLFQWMRDNNFLCSLGERHNQPTQRAVEMGLFEMRKTTINVGDHSKVRTTTKVTGKGQIYFVNKFLYTNQQSAT
jgi:anti-repressor protein